MQPSTQPPHPPGPQPAPQLAPRPAAEPGDRAAVRRREIRDGDLPGVVDLLLRGFANRPRAYWANGLARMAARPAVEGCPRFGFLLDDGTRPVGVALTLFGRGADGGVRCNLSSWTVDPAYRAQAPLLIASALRRAEVTFTNISPAPHTWPIIESQGFRAYSEGQSLMVPLLGRAGERATVSSDPASWRGLPEAALLDDHRSYGCSCLTVAPAGAPRGDPRPIVLLPVRARAGRYPLPMMQVVYCRDAEDVPRFAGALGRWMAGRGAVALLVDGDLPAGAVGRRRVRHNRKYARGPNPPRVGDLSYTELVLFGP